MAYPLDAKRTALMPTGVVRAALVFAVNNEGKYRTTGEQEADDNGLPIWEVEAVETSTNRYGRTGSETITVLIASRTEPKVESFVRQGFENLTLDAFVQQGKNGGRATLGKKFWATGVISVGGEQK